MLARSARSHLPYAICIKKSDLMLDGLVEHVERLPGTLVQELVQQKGEPGAEHLLRHALRAPEQQLGMRLPLHAPLYQVTQQGLQDVRAVFHPGKGTEA